MAKFSFMKILPLLMTTATNIAYIDRDENGKIDGKEKMAFVQGTLKSVMQAFPEVGAKLKAEPEKTEEFIDKLVEAFDVIVK